MTFATARQLTAGKGDEEKQKRALGVDPSTRRYAGLGAIDRGTRSAAVVASTRNFVMDYLPVGPNDPETGRPTWIDIPVSIETFDLRRFRKNPVVLWVHERDGKPIGLAEDLEEGEGELRMRVVFARAVVNPEAESIFEGVSDRLIRGVSIGFDVMRGQITETVVQGQRALVARNVPLLEVSLCPVPADEDALVDEPETPETREARRLADAGRALRQARFMRPKTDSGEDFVVHLDWGKLGKVERTQVGGVRVPARLARVGVLRYRLPDGKIRRELRLPEEVFNADSMATLRGAPVTVDHPKTPTRLLDPTTWKTHSVGHVENVRADGDYIVGELVVNDAEAITKLDSGELADVSLGYHSWLEFTPGVYKGEEYDCIQRGITINHTAILPPGGGRSGREVGVRLDAKDDAACVEEQEIIMKQIRIDGKDYEVGSDAHLDKLDEVHKRELQAATAPLQTRLDSLDGELKTTRSKVDELTGVKDALELKAKELQTKLDAALEPAAIEARVTERVELVTRARTLLGAEVKLDGKTPREIMIECIRTDSNHANFDGKDRSDDYVRGIFETLAARPHVDSIDNIVRTHRAHIDNADLPDPDKARSEMEKRNRNQGTQPLAFSKDQPTS